MAIRWRGGAGGGGLFPLARLRAGRSGAPGGSFAQARIKLGIGFLQVRNDLEVLAARALERDAFDMHEAQELAHRFGHGAAAFVSRAAALRDSDAGPEFLL